jgi:hypothetical protein
MRAVAFAIIFVGTILANKGEADVSFAESMLGAFCFLGAIVCIFAGL